MRINKKQIFAYLGFFIFSISLLMAEIVYSRTARIAFGYEYQLLVISLAISGIGFGGVPVYYLFRRIKSRVNLAQVVLALVYAASLPLPFLTVNNLGAQYASENYAELTYFGVTTATMAQFCAAVFFVYFFAGILIAVFYRQNDRDIGAVNSLSLIGSAAGALLVVPVLNLLGDEKTVVIVFAAAILGFLLFLPQAKLSRYLMAGLLILSIVAIAAVNNWAPAFMPGGPEPGAVASGSNSFSQVSAFPVSPYGEAKNLSQTYDKSVKPRTQGYNLVYDRKLKTNAVVFSKLSDTAYLKYDLLYFPYFLVPKADVMLIGTGGGIDVVRARLAEIPKITAVEMNQLIIDISRKKLKTTAYDDKRVTLIVGEARTTILRLNEKYDLIFMSNVGGFGGKTANSRYYPENYLHTQEAYRTYFDHLKPGGILSVGSRSTIVKEYIGVGIAAISNLGLNPNNRVAVIDGNGLSVVIFKPAGFTAKDRQRIAMNAKRLKFDVTYPFQPLSDTAANGYMTDDKPFLGDKDALALIRGTKTQFGDSAAESEYYSLMTTGTLNGQTGAPSDNEDGFLPLRFLGYVAIAAAAAVLLLIFIPLIFKTVRTSKKYLTVLGLMVFFCLLGLGFMSFELVMLQRAFLFVGHPAYATAVVLATFLFFSGIGSWATGRIKPAGFKSAAGAAGSALVVLLAAYAYLLNTVFIDQLWLPQTIRVVIFVAMLAVPCLLSGVLFPLGLRVTGLVAEDLIPWAWSVNGLAIVAGSAMGALGSYFFGFRVVLGAGAACYLAAVAVFILLRFTPD